MQGQEWRSVCRPISQTPTLPQRLGQAPSLQVLAVQTGSSGSFELPRQELRGLELSPRDPASSCWKALLREPLYRVRQSPRAKGPPALPLPCRTPCRTAVSPTRGLSS